MHRIKLSLFTMFLLLFSAPIVFASPLFGGANPPSTSRPSPPPPPQPNPVMSPDQFKNTVNTLSQPAPTNTPPPFANTNQNTTTPNFSNNNNAQETAPSFFGNNQTKTQTPTKSTAAPAFGNQATPASSGVYTGFGAGNNNSGNTNNAGGWNIKY